MLGCVMKLQALQEAVRFGGGKGFLERRGGMGIEVVLYDADRLSVRVLLIE